MDRPVLRSFCLRVVLFGCLAFGCAQAPAQDLPDTCRNPYSQQQEIALGDKVVREVYRQMPVLPDTDPVAVYVRQLGARLVAAAPLTPGLTQQWPFTFHVVASSEINAFALPGGTMFVNLGAVQAAQTEAQLAGVMGHEMSHVILRHSTCNLVKQQHRSLLYGLGQIGSELALGGAGGDLAAQGLGVARNLNFLHMSRGDEKQADMLGVHIVHDAGFDPRGLPQFFEIILAKTGQQGKQFLSDHPNPGNRTDYLNREIATLPALEHPIVSTPAFVAAHQEAGTEHALSAAEMANGNWRGSGLYATGPGVGAGVDPVSAQAAGYPAIPMSPNTSGSPSAGSPAPQLSPRQLGIGSALVPFELGHFAISAPSTWRQLPASDGRSGVILAPVQGTGAFGTSYGVTLGVVQQTGQGVQGQAELQRASDLVATRLMSSSGLQPDGAPSSLMVAGQPATSRYLQGASPVVAADGATGRERDWLVTIARPDGDLDTLVFTGPTKQFPELETLFRRMLASFRPQ